MIEKSTIEIIGTLARRDGVSAKTIETALDVLANDGMVAMTQARKVLNLSARTIKRMCEQNGIRRDSRFGRKGSVVDLNALRALPQ